jgi:diguanylate cyclase (GGDEF)-like protein
MLHLDIRTLLVVLAINSLMAAAALPSIMGRGVSRAAQWAQLSVGLQALTWISLLMAGLWFGTWVDWGLSTLAIASLSASWLAMFYALEGWLGPRPGRHVMQGLTVLCVVGYGLGFGNYPFRVGWCNLILATQMAIVGTVAWLPASAASRHWRALLSMCLFTLGAVTAWRGVLGAFFTSAYPTFLSPHTANLAFAVGGNVALMLSTVAILVAWREEAERQLHNQAVTDGLTGVLNRRAWTEAAMVCLAEAQRNHRPLVVMMIDIDHFKQINDNHGHETGDRALQLMATQLRQNVRTGDLVGRYGGEEFCLLLNRANGHNARALDQRLRLALTESAREHLGLRLDFSAGIAERPARATELDALLRQADGALYHAKRSGRGRLAGGSDDPSIEPATASAG